MNTTLTTMTACVLLCACDPPPEPEGEPARCLEGIAPHRVATDHPLATVLQSALEAAVDDGLPGVVMAIRDRDGVWEGAAGQADLGRGEPMQTCHRTRIASVTKTFVAATVLALAQRGAIELDAPLTDYLPDMRGRIPHAEAITIRQLMSHTSGVRNFIDIALVLDLFNRPSRTWTMAECFDHAAGHDAEFAPGTDWSYSNTNYLLLGWVIEAVEHTPHDQVMNDEIFAPLGLQETRYHADRFDFGGVVHGYFDLMGDRALVDASDSYANLCVGPDGGMVSSARDLLSFYDHLLARRDLLDTDLLSAMMPAVATGEQEFPRYGLGLEQWGEGDRLGIGHGGHEFGYRTFAYHFPAQDVTFVVWFNASSLIPGEDNISVEIDRHRDRLRDLALRWHEGR